MTQASTEAQAFHEMLHENHMYGLWELASQMTPHPQPKMLSYMWKWSLLEPIIRRSGEVVPVGNERRALQLFNPGLGGRWATTHSLIAAVQLLLPGEIAKAHRHTPVAIRFIMEGSGAYTVVDGERVYMHPGDLILTPSWSWHAHGNETEGPVVWLDGLDIPLMQSLESMFFEMYPSPELPLTRPADSSTRAYGQPQLRPTWLETRPGASPLLMYSWERTRQALEDLRGEAGDEYDGISLAYTHPQTGGSVLPTMACRVQMLRPGERLKAHRHTGSSVYYVAEGEGETIIDGQAFIWQKGDIIAVAPWALHQHSNMSASTDAVLFSIHDRPVLDALGHYREEQLTENDGRQAATSVFAAL